MKLILLHLREYFWIIFIQILFAKCFDLSSDNCIKYNQLFTVVCKNKLCKFQILHCAYGVIAAVAKREIPQEPKRIIVATLRPVYTTRVIVIAIAGSSMPTIQIILYSVSLLVKLLALFFNEKSLK